MASKNWTSDRVYSLYHRVCQLFMDLTFTTSGAVSALTAASNLGIKTVVQAAAAAAGAGGDVFVVGLADAFYKILGLDILSVGSLSTVTALALVASGNSVCAITAATAIAGNTVTFTTSAGSFTFTAVAYNGSVGASGDGKFRVGNSNDGTTATNLTAAINGTDGTPQTSLTSFPSAIKAIAYGSTVIVYSTTPGVWVSSNSQTTLAVVTDVANTVSVARQMPQGFVMRSVGGASVATVATTGDNLRVTITCLDQV